ncbi:hypothetical protein [Alkalibacillus aidingensis]|uniref:hypothetical protein n=1 Tax=Alkalibacillus aidingensis TaxID=2747607 RepID=UPI00166061E1|nr:hypothetical protein [Alkalibacillus aidingensis]
MNDSRDRKDSRSEYDLDVDRMINEGLAGGHVNPKDEQVQIEELHDIRENDEPFPEAKTNNETSK